MALHGPGPWWLASHMASEPHGFQITWRPGCHMVLPPQYLNRATLPRPSHMAGDSRGLWATWRAKCAQHAKRATSMSPLA
jgi:hypothetical protein